MIINIHAGHNPDGKSACGAVGLIKESTEARLVKDKVITYLKEMGNTVYDCTVDNGTGQSDILNKIVRNCNSHTVDLDISIHFNSGRNDYKGDGSVGGTEVWVYKTGSMAFAAAEDIAKSISGLGFRNRGVKVSKDLYFLAKTKAEALLIECCFVDDMDDIKIYNPEAMAKAIVKGITGKEVKEENNVIISKIEDFEKWLNSFLKINLPVDGEFSMQDKKAAIMAFQRLGNIDGTGNWDNKAGKLANKSQMHTRLGDNGELVKLLQGMMIVNGIYFGELHGIFDLNTTNTVLHFQKVWNLNQHGIAGTQVWKKLFE